MISPNQIKSQRSYLNLTSPPTSPNSDCFFKKKQFSRKPGFQNISNVIEPHRKIDRQSPSRSNAMNQTISYPTNQLKTNIQSSQNLLKDICTRQTIIPIKHSIKDPIFYSPKTDQRILWNDLSLLHSTNSQKSLEDKLLKESIDSTFNKSSVSQCFNQATSREQTLQGIEPKHHFKQRTSSTIVLAQIRGKNQKSNKETQSQISKVNSCSSKSLKNVSIQCFYCKNNKKITEIANERFNKLEKQYNQKVKQFSQLQKLCNSLKQQKAQLLNKNQKIMEQLYNTQSLLTILKQDITEKTQTYRSQMIKVKERLKYVQIQKSMLLRVKEDHHVLTKSNLQLKNQHQVMKKNIIATTQNKSNHSNFFKNKQSHILNSKYSKTAEKGFYQGKPGNDKDNIHFDYQDDDISLDLSQYSVDTH